MSKTTLPKFEDYKAPWEIDSTGAAIPEDEQKLDPARLKKFLHGLLSDKERLQTTVETVTAERDDVKGKLDAKAREGESDDAKSKREREEAIAAAEKKGSLAALKLEVALDIDGITPAQAKRLAKRLTGETQEELEADAKAIAEDFGLGKKDESKDDDDKGDDKVVPGRPRAPRAAGDPEPNQANLPASDADTVNKLFPRR